MKYRKFFYIFSALLVIASVIFIALFRLPLGIDFKGGSFMEIKFVAEIIEQEQSQINIEEPSAETSETQQEADSEVQEEVQEEAQVESEEDSSSEEFDFELPPEIEQQLQQQEQQAQQEQQLAEQEAAEEQQQVVAAEVDVPSREEIAAALGELDIGQVNIQPGEDNSYILRFREVDESTHQEILSSIAALSESELVEEQFQSVGPVIGAETIEKSYQAIIVVLIMIVIYVAWAFRKISYPIGSVRYGLIALVALFHDVLITVGFFAIFTHIKGTEIGVPFVAALLTIVGYSVNDTIVIFDRVRENLSRIGGQKDFEDLVSDSVKENIVRSLNTSLTTLFVLFAIFFFGGATIHNFVFTLIIGIAIGTYSSLFLASPLLVSWAKRIR
ncbi:MAG: protein translocase subunit SecF [Candidatus Spechtbacterales bacterium]|nr:protein translocase subunit SecF [Candidatus Spechtbacterales bacterium]